MAEFYHHLLFLHMFAVIKRFNICIFCSSLVHECIRQRWLRLQKDYVYCLIRCIAASYDLVHCNCRMKSCIVAGWKVQQCRCRLHVFLEEKQDPLEGRFLIINILCGTISKQALTAMIIGRNKYDGHHKAYIAQMHTSFSFLVPFWGRVQE